MDVNIEDLTSSLIREFLHRKKCLQTLKVLDEEWPRSESSISSRSKLAKALCIEKWIASNQSSTPSFKTMLEVILHNIIQMNVWGESRDTFVIEKKHAPTSVNTEHFAGIKNQVRESAKPTRPHTAVRKKHSKHEVQYPHSTGEALEDVNVNDLDDIKLVKVESLEFTNEVAAISNRSTPRSSNAFFHKSDSQNSVNNKAFASSLDELLAGVPQKNVSTTNQTLKKFGAFSPEMSVHKTLSGTIDTAIDKFTYDVAKDLRELIFGTTKIGFQSEWCGQNFTFWDCTDRPKLLRYGIVQKKGGPCGVLAAVQAIVLKHLLFSGRGKYPSESSLNVDDDERTKCLSETIVEMLWRAGESQRATLALLSARQQFSSSPHEYRTDGVTEYVMTLNFSSQAELKKAVCENINSYERGKGSCILLLYSAILSRGIDLVKSDMDESGAKLMGAHNYCTQEMVNLLLIGRATSNAFDNSIQLDQMTLLKGVHARVDVGLLSLFEHYGSCKIGDFYKAPKYPIWIICSESHYTVLFGLNSNLTSKFAPSTAFDLYYYDGLANQNEAIKLTIDTSLPVTDNELNGDLVPPLEHCIRTKWFRAHVDWNGTEPLL